MSLPKGLITGRTAKLPTTSEIDRAKRQSVPPMPSHAARMWTLAIPGWMPTPLNKIVNSHYGTAHRLKKKDKEIIGSAVWAYGVPGATEKRRVSLLIVLPPKKRACDPDAFFKSVLDALVYNGALKTDTANGVELGSVEFARGKSLCTFITLEEC